MKKNLFLSFTMFLCILLLFACKETEEKAVIANDSVDKSTAELIEKIIVPTNPDGNIDSTALAKIVYDQNVYFFDTVNAGTLVSHSFSFSNQGNSNLFILDTQSSCGCTVAGFSKDAIAVGEKSEITINFDTTNKKGKQKKQIIVFSNSLPNKSILTLQGFVK